MCACRASANFNPRRTSAPFFLERADTPEKARIGLSNRFSLKRDMGMFFPATNAHITMWMKDTYIPLDMVFFQQDGKIVLIHTAQPLDLTPVSVNQPVVGVIELLGGICQQLKINAGDTVIFTE